MNRNKNKPIISIIVSLVLVLAHFAIMLVSVKAIKYYALYPEVFNLLGIIAISTLFIIDIIFFVGFKGRDLIQKIVVFILATFICIGGLYGTNLIDKATETVGSVISVDSSENKTETVGGIFTTYKDEYKNVISVEGLKNYDDLKVGTLLETSENSVSSIGINNLSKAGVSYKNISYTNNTDLLFALIGGSIDVAIFSNMYRAVFRADENVDYSQYLDQINEFGEFEKSIEISANSSSKDLSNDPFNVLLIGWSPIIGSDTIGLADAIIVATVNPQTYTVSMMSIARDSYVPISCYGGECDKINSGRGTSMDCFVNTVENLINEEIDFYMEIDFTGFSVLVDCLGGVEIDNPVSFELDGVYVPAGNYVATGWQALEFARERHHMPNGDFDRQQHQKEVIMQIAKKFIKHDITFALGVFNEISPFLNTNMTLNQIAGVFNMIKSTKNYTGLSLFKILDMHALRITGYADWHYSDEYELPLWIYRLYQGSINESLEHMHEVMGEYSNIDQYDGFQFNVDSPYERGLFFSLQYNEEETHETLPPYYKNLISMTYLEALDWAKSNGVTLEPTFILNGDEKYNESLEGMVISQSVAYGKKISKYPICKITVMGSGYSAPDFDSWGDDSLKLAKKWCEEHGYSYDIEAKYVTEEEAGNYSDGQVYKMKYINDGNYVQIKYYKVCGSHSQPNSDNTSCECEEGYSKDKESICKLMVTYTFIKDGVTIETKEGIAGTKPNWVEPSDDYVCGWSPDGLTFECTKCEHDYGEWQIVNDSTCEKTGLKMRICSNCGKEETDIISLKEHNYGEWQTVKEAQVGEAGREERECSVCHHKEQREIAALEG